MEKKKKKRKRLVGQTPTKMFAGFQILTFEKGAVHIRNPFEIWHGMPYIILASPEEMMKHIQRHCVVVIHRHCISGKKYNCIMSLEIISLHCSD